MLHITTYLKKNNDRCVIFLLMQKGKFGTTRICQIVHKSKHYSINFLLEL
jgi:hypothetical protein